MIEYAVAGLPWPGLEVVGLVGPLVGAVLAVLAHWALIGIGIGIALAVGLLWVPRA